MATWQHASVSTAVAPWPRPGYRPTGRAAIVVLLAFSSGDVLDAAGDLRLAGVVPATAPVAALELRRHHYPDSATWFDRWRTGPLRNIALQQLGNVQPLLEQASYCYSIRVEVDDPPDLAYLQLVWALAARLAQAGTSLTLDAAAATWHRQADVAALAPHRPFNIQHEVSVIAETEPVPGFGHPVHTRGMIKFGRPDLIAGVPADRIEETGRILNHLARRLAEGDVLAAGQRVRVNERRTLLVSPYVPDETTPDVVLSDDGLRLIDL